jgi:hypothetical protein
MNLAKLLAAASNLQQAYPAYMSQRPGRGVYYSAQEAGFQTAMSKDGKVLAVLSLYSSTLLGSRIFIYTRTGQVWSEFAEITLDQYHASSSEQGSLALSSDGSTLAYGCPVYSATGGSNSGSVSVYVRSGSAYTLQQEFQASAPTAYGGFGVCTCLSDDGNSLVTSHNSGSATYMFFYARSAGTWSLSQLVSLGHPAVGTSISVSSDMTKCVVGNIAESRVGGGPYGILYFLTKTSGSWSITQQIDASLITTYNSWADKVVISGDGQTMAVGCMGNLTGNRPGRVFVYKLVAGVWSSSVEIPYPLTSDSATYNRFGLGLALDSVGKTLVVSAPMGNASKGAAWVYSNTGGGWVLQSNLYIYKTATAAAPGYSGYCEAVQISGDGAWVCVPDRTATAGTAAYNGAGDVWLIPR